MEKSDFFFGTLFMKLFVLFLFLLSAYSQTSPDSCFFTDTNTCFYNLTSLIIPSDAPIEDYYVFVLDDGFNEGEHYTNVCQYINPSATECEENESSCQQNPSGENLSCGRVDSGRFSSIDGTNGNGM